VGGHLDYFRNRFAARRSRFLVFAEGREYPFLIARIARSLIRAAFANSFDGIFLSTSFSKLARGPNRNGGEDDLGFSG